MTSLEIHFSPFQLRNLQRNSHALFFILSVYFFVVRGTNVSKMSENMTSLKQPGQLFPFKVTPSARNIKSYSF